MDETISFEWTVYWMTWPAWAMIGVLAVVNEYYVFSLAEAYGGVLAVELAWLSVYGAVLMGGDIGDTRSTNL